MRIEILCTGDEVLTGKTINTNYSHVARRLQEVGLEVAWGTTVGDDRASLLAAFHLAAGRADAVIVNGGLGPTVDDLSQEVAAEAVGVPLVLDEGWLAHIQAFYTARGREMPENNRKQAMLPEGAELIDNPVGTACGFAVDIDDARFYFTPGVPRELRRMLDDEIIPRLLARRGTRAVVRLKRFHSFGLGESRVDVMLNGVEALAPSGEVKLGFQAHYPQLETKLLASGTDEAELDARLAPVEAAVRERLGAYLLAEDAETLESVLLDRLSDLGGTLAVAECGTHGAVGGRLVAGDPSGVVLARSAVTATASLMAQALDVADAGSLDGPAAATRFAEAARESAAASHGLAVLVSHRPDVSQGWAHVAISRVGEPAVERSSCLVGGAERVRTGAVELGLDCLRRTLAGLAVDDKIDFEKQDVETTPGRASA